MFRLLHSADWQLGARFSQFGAQGARLREARLETLQRALALARQHTVDAFLIAGDLFEDNQVTSHLRPWRSDTSAAATSVTRQTCDAIAAR